MRKIIGMAVAMTVGWAGAAGASAPAVSLKGSPAAMELQNRVAKEHSLNFYRTAAEIRAAVERGELIEASGNEDYAVAEFVQHPFLQPEALLFVERLSRQYREACGQKLVLTSAVRPISGQPSNSHRLSVHPAGMAIDLRVSDRAECRSWLESALLDLESKGVLNGIRERNPPHYHVAIFPSQYMAYAQERMEEEAQLALEQARADEAERARVAAATATAVQATGAAAGFLPVKQERQGGFGSLAAAVGLLAIPFGVGMALRRKSGR